MLCKCVNIKIGSYDNQVMLKRPEHMIGRTEGSSNKKFICIDKCLSEEIQYLWKLGIRTTGCCCGHNIKEGYIGVIKEDRKIMEGLGYYEISDGNFLPKSHWDWDGDMKLSFNDYFYPKTEPIKERRGN